MRWACVKHALDMCGACAGLLLGPVDRGSTLLGRVGILVLFLKSYRRKPKVDRAGWVSACGDGDSERH